MEQVKIFEVGPRDGLQNEKQFIDTADKLQLISMLAETGLQFIEATSFVNPMWIPQLADAAEVMQLVPKVDHLTYSALVPNRKGLERALESGMKEIAVFMSASESHNRKNINKGIAETSPILREVVEAAKEKAVSVRGYVSTAFGCPYEGEISIQAVTSVADELLKMGVYEISLGDTIGVATPKQVKEKLNALLKLYPAKMLAGHFHDTWGTGIANVYAALEAGIRTFDSSIGGLGGCPYAPGAAGNIATEDLIYLLEGMGIHTGVDLKKLAKAGSFIQTKLGRKLPSKVLAAMQAC